jgi:hypothetical protein
MTVSSTPSGGITFSRIPLHLVELFRQIPGCSELGSERAGERLFPPPVKDGKSPIRQDWHSYVVPGLQEHFLAERSVVESDLRGLVDEDGVFRLEIPAGHCEAWLGALNQVRLAVAAEHGLEETDLNREELKDVMNQRDLAVLRVHFYGVIQQLLIDHIA